MKIWITRSSAFSIQCGGLERLFVWFRKPIWTEKFMDLSSYDSPFGEVSNMNGGRIEDWESGDDSGNMWVTQPYSFGNLFGYGDREEESENEISRHVWKKLEEHFGNVDFKEWDKYEKENEKCHRKYFLLELDINMKL